MVIFDIFTKRKISLDHLRMGLSSLKVLDAIKGKPECMKKFFVHSGVLSSDEVISRMNHVNGSESETTAFNNVLKSFSANMLKKFLQHTTGTPSLWALRGDRQLRIKFVDSDSFSCSTSFLELKVPRNTIRNNLLKGCLEALITEVSGNFNTL